MRAKGVLCIQACVMAVTVEQGRTSLDIYTGALPTLLPFTGRTVYRFAPGDRVVFTEETVDRDAYYDKLLATYPQHFAEGDEKSPAEII